MSRKIFVDYDIAKSVSNELDSAISDLEKIKSQARSASSEVSDLKHASCDADDAENAAENAILRTRAFKENLDNYVQHVREWDSSYAANLRKIFSGFAAPENANDNPATGGTITYARMLELAKDMKSFNSPLLKSTYVPQPGDPEFIGPVRIPQPGDFDFIGPVQVKPVTLYDIADNAGQNIMDFFNEMVNDPDMIFWRQMVIGRRTDEEIMWPDMSSWDEYWEEISKITGRNQERLKRIFNGQADWKEYSNFGLEMIFPPFAAFRSVGQLGEIAKYTTESIPILRKVDDYAMGLIGIAEETAIDVMEWIRPGQLGAMLTSGSPIAGIIAYNLLSEQTKRYLDAYARGVYKGGLLRDVTGLASMVVDPWGSIAGIGNALGNPMSTASAIGQAIYTEIAEIARTGDIELALERLGTTAYTIAEIAVAVSEIRGARRAREIAEEMREQAARISNLSDCSPDDLYQYLKQISPEYGDEFLKTGEWPDDIQVPKNPNVLNADGTIDWSQVPNGGYALDDAGNAIKEAYNPKAGEILDRYGEPNGRYTSPVQNDIPYSYDQRSLPYVEDVTKYHQYEVLDDFANLKTHVDFNANIELRNQIYNTVEKYYDGDWSKVTPYRGEVASGFGCSGGGIQYELPLPVDVLEELEMLKEIS